MIRLIAIFLSLFCLTASANPQLTASSQYEAFQKLSQKLGLIAVKLSPSAVKLFQKRVNYINDLNNIYVANNKLPPKIDLGMNGVPHLDQNPYATCETFAITEALDAALGKGDYISQQCLLELANDLNQYNYYQNAWNGSEPDIIIPLIQQFGIISKAKQKQGVCAGITHYPNNPVHWHNPATDAKLTPAQYHNYSKNIFHNNFKFPRMYGEFITWKALIRLPRYFVDGARGTIVISNDPTSDLTPNQALALVKKALAEGDRVTIGYLITPGFIAGRYNSNYLNTWFLTPQMKKGIQHPKTYSGAYHEVLLYGYNDDAIATGPKHETQNGVFYVRNSWGGGIQKFSVGKYNLQHQYMTYDYFKTMVVDADSIIVYKINKKTSS